MTRLSKAVDYYLTMRHQLGFKLKNTKYVLNGFAAYLQSKKASYITSKLALEFAMQNRNSSPSQWAARLVIIRRFALHMHAMDPRTEVPPQHLLPYSYHRRSPYIYSNNDIIKLLDACKNVRPKNPLYSQTYYTLLGLIAVTGMRTSEALTLNRESVDMTLGIITIRESKFRKSRKIPIHSSVVKMLKKYADHRDRYLSKQRLPYFFLTIRGCGVGIQYFEKNFVKICILAGLRKQGKPGGPRIIDLRHTFAVQTLIKCYQDGLNVDAVIPILSRYLGHDNPVHTYWYLTGTPELLNLINTRLEKKFGGR